MRKPGSCRRAIGRLVALLMLLVAATSYGSYESGVAWLLAQQGSDGAFYSADTTATPIQATAEAVIALAEAGALDADRRAAALSFLQRQAQENSEYLARQVLAAVAAGQPVGAQAAQLLAVLNDDGGLGDLPGYDSAVVNTAFSLSATAAAGLPPSVQTAYAVNYLLNEQQSSGGWADGPNHPSVYVSALAMRALWLYRSQFRDVAASVERARNFLLSQKAPGGGWNSVSDTALSLIAILPTELDKTPYDSAVAALWGAQEADGSWGKDVYATALALRAISARNARFPDLGVIQGYVIDGDTGRPLAGVSIALSGAVTAVLTTGGDGRFEFEDLPAGGYQLDIAYAGYSSVRATLTLQTGRSADLGQIALVKASNSTTATVRGVVTDLVTGNPISGASVTVLGTSLAATTGNDGSYQLANVPVGVATLVASAPGYAAASVSTMLGAGQIALFSPALQVQDAQGTAVVRGQVTDRETGAPLAGVRVAVVGSALYATTDNSGRYQLAGVPAGQVTLETYREGYQRALGSAFVESGQILDFSPSLLKQVDRPATLEGVVTAAATSQPLAGVSVTVTGEGVTLSAVTGADGTYRIEGLPLTAVVISAEYPGFVTASVQVTPQPGGRLIFSPGLLAVDDGTELPTSGIVAQVVDLTNGQLIAGALARLAVGGHEFFATSTSEGELLFEALPAGDAVLTITAAGFESVVIPVTIPFRTILSLGELALSPESFHQQAGFKGRVIDAGSNRPLAGVTVVAEFGGVVHSRLTDDTGHFELTGFVSLNGNARLTMPGYADVQLGLVLTLGQVLDVGDLPMRPVTAEELLPDLAIESLNRDGLSSDPATFSVSGYMRISVKNRGTSSAQAPITALGFVDRDGDGRYDASVDVAVGRVQLPGDLLPGESVELVLPVAGVLPFRDAPIHIWLDSDETVVEASESNNFASTAGLCGHVSDGPSVDLALCMDSSGSVSAANFTLQLNGTASAVENPEILPHDGSVRITVLQFDSATRVEVPPTVVTADNAATLAARIRAIRKSGGGTSIHSCIDTARQQILAASPASAIQVIDVSTDGQSGRQAAIDASLRAQQAGIDSLNAIGVGSGIDQSLLNAIVFPQPAGGDKGFVLLVKSYQEYAEAIANKVQRETRITDLTAGGLRVIDQGEGQPLLLRVVIGNGGNGPSPEGVVVRFYAGLPEAGGAVLAQSTVPALEPGTAIEVEVSVAGLVDGQPVVAEIDPDGTVVECNRANNKVQITPRTALGTIGVATDALQYGPGETASITAEIGNSGSLAGTFVVDLRIEDSAGNIVAAFEPRQVDVTGGGGSVVISESWDTGRVLAGTYVVKGVLSTREHGVVGEDSTSFAIIAGEHPGAAVALRVTPDRPEYHTTDTVRLESLIRNVTSNALLPAATLALSVVAPDDSVVFETVLSLSDLAPGALRELSVLQQLEAAMPGAYRVRGEVADGDGTTLAVAETGYRVVDDPKRSLAGRVTVQRAVLQQGETQVCVSRLDNTGTQPIASQAVRQQIVTVSDQLVVSGHSTSVDLAAGQSIRIERSYPTQPLAAGDYACVLEAKIGDQWQSLGYATFQVEVPPVNVDGELMLGDRGRLLVLLDGGRQQPATGGQCGWRGGRRLELDFAQPLPVGARIDVEVFDADATLVAAKSVVLGEPTEDEEDSDGATLEVQTLNSRGMALVLRGGERNAVYRAVATVSRDEDEETVQTSFTPFACGCNFKHGGNYNVTPWGWQDYLWWGDVRERDPYGPLRGPRLSEQRTFLENLLKANGWSYTVVTDAASFERELKSDGYAVYALFNERVKLSEHAQRLLRTRVEQGAGLLVAGPHDMRNGRLLPALGVQFRGHWLLPHGVELASGPLSDGGRGSFIYPDHYLKVALAGAAAEGLFTYQGLLPKLLLGKTQPVALTRYQYGAGRSVFTAFDLLLYATEQGANGLYARTLLKSLAYVHPPQLQVKAGGVVPLVVRLSNRGIATPGQVALSLPVEASVVDAGGAAQGVGGLEWSFQLPEQGELSLPLWVRLPPQPGFVSFQGMIRVGEGASLRDHKPLLLQVQAR